MPNYNPSHICLNLVVTVDLKTASLKKAKMSSLSRSNLVLTRIELQEHTHTNIMYTTLTQLSYSNTDHKPQKKHSQTNIYDSATP